jgi:arginyl-tRNA--protein-N-Asp/Glu arginylyltransferase
MSLGLLRRSHGHGKRRKRRGDQNTKQKMQEKKWCTSSVYNQQRDGDSTTGRMISLQATDLLVDGTSYLYPTPGAVILAYSF